MEEIKKASKKELEEIAAAFNRIPEDKQKEVVNFVKGYSFATELANAKKAVG